MKKIRLNFISISKISPNKYVRYRAFFSFAMFYNNFVIGSKVKMYIRIHYTTCKQRMQHKHTIAKYLNKQYVLR